MASPHDRRVMAQLTADWMGACGVCDVELRREGPSFTIDTLAVLRAERPADELLFIIGADTVGELPTWKEAALRRDVTRPPRRAGARYLQLPPLADAVFELAERITSGSRSDAERVRAIESHLRRTGRYSDTPPPLDPEGKRSPVETFLLGETSGHCEYFATAMVMLARSQGLPARVVNGFAGGRRNRIGGFVEVTRSDAHAWVEVHYESAGWVRYDPTPPDLRLRAPADTSLLTHLAEFGSALELWWFQRVVGFDRSDQMRAMKVAWLAWRGGRDAGLPVTTPVGKRDWKRWKLWEALSLRGALALGGALSALTLALRMLRGGRRGQRLPPAYAGALRLLARRGLTREPCATARDFAQRASAGLPPAAGVAFGALTECYLSERFGDRPTPAAAAELRRMRDALRAS